MKLIVAITVNDRPEYMAQVIESWREVRGGDEVDFIFQCEPRSPSMELCRKADVGRLGFVFENKHKLGALGNPYAALSASFDHMGADFVVLGEDDSIVTGDVLEYFQFCAEVFRDDPKCVAVCSFQQRPLGPAYDVVCRHYFASVVWGTWANRWSYLKEHWRMDYEPAWDQMLLDLSQGLQYSVFPAVSRSQHIGRYGGTHMREDEFTAMQAQKVHNGSMTKYFVRRGIFE